MAKSVDWNRWHELLDIRDKRGLTPDEEAEHQRFAHIAAQLDAEEGKAADAALDKLVKEHERRLASLERLTQALIKAS